MIKETMTVEIFDKTIRETLRQLSISTDENLLGFQIDIDHSLEQAGLFRNIVVSKTNIDACALLSICEMQKANVSDGEIVETLESIWLTELRYENWEVHVFEKGNKQITMRFATSNGISLFVTGQIIVGR